METYAIDNHVIHSDVSDHYATLTKIKGLNRTNKHEEIFLRKANLSKEEWEKFNSELQEALSEIEENINDLHPNVYANYIVDTYQSLVNKYMPMSKLSRKETRFHNKPWITTAIKKSIAQKDKMHISAKKTGDQKKWEDYKKYRNILTRTKAKAYESYYYQKVQEYGQDKAKTWRLINEIARRKKNKRSSVDCIVDKNGEKHRNKKNIANCFNGHFSTVGKCMDEEINQLDLPNLKNPLEYISDKLCSWTNMRDTDPSEISTLISELEEISHL